MSITPYFLDGVFQVLGSVPEIAVVIDSPRCELERAYTIGNLHDRYNPFYGDGPYDAAPSLASINYWSEGSDILGVEAKLEKRIKSLAEKHPEKTIVLVKGLLSLIVNTDDEGIIHSLEKDLKNPIDLVEQDSIDRDWIEGWRRTHELIMSQIISEEGDDIPIVTGMGVLRKEGDELGNINEIKRLISELDLPEFYWPFSGMEDKLKKVLPHATRLSFPWDDYSVDDNTTDILRVDFPFGIKKTVDFVEKLAQKYGKAEIAQRLIKREKELARRQLLPIVTNRLAGCGAIIVGNANYSEGLWHMMKELGVDVPLIICLETSYSYIPFDKITDSGTKVLIDPDVTAIRAEVKDLADKAMADLVVGSGLIVDISKENDLAHIEIGFPCFREHFATDAPYMGFKGIVRLAERMDNALALIG